MRPAPSSSSPVNRGRPTKSSGSASGHETTRNTCQRHYVRRCSVNLESIPSKLKATGVILRQNPCPTVWYVLVLAKVQGKEAWALPKKLAKAFEDYGKGRIFGRPFFKTNPQELSTLCIYPKQLLNKAKNVSINETLSITTLAQYFYPTT